MYDAIIENGSERLCLFYSGVDELALIDPVLKLKLNHSGQFNFEIPATHPCWDKLVPLVTRVKVYKNGTIIYSGRILSINEDFQKTKEVFCEGDMGYLLDSIVRPFEYEGSVGDLFRKMVENHNAQVDPEKRFNIGEVSASTAASPIKMSVTDAVKTMSFFSSNFFVLENTYIRARYEGEKRYLDMVSDYGGENQQPVRFGENLLDLTQKIDPSNIMTAIVPYGAQLDDGSRVDIKSVNGGSDTLVDEDGFKTYGYIIDAVQWDDVTDPQVLKEKAIEHLKNSSYIADSFELRAIDLSMAHVDVEELKLGRWTWFESPPHGIKKRLLLSGLDIHLTDPARNMVMLGAEMKTFTQKIKETNAKVNNSFKSMSSDIINKILNATNLITGGKGGYVVIDIYDPDTGKQMHPWRILIMDAPDKENAKSVIQINKNGLGFSTTGINGPYRNAWTIDGNLVADFITSGTMLADRIRGGSLEVGGSGLGRDGKIIVKDANDNVIGYWDKTGLHVLKGVIEGSEIKGSSFTGGTINIGNGTFEVDRDGAVTIESGEISIGNTLISENYTWLGDYGISSTGDGVLYSRDRGSSVEIHAANSSLEDGPLILLKKGGTETRIRHNAISTKDIYLNDPWVDDWGLVRMLKDLYDRVGDLERSQN